MMSKESTHLDKNEKSCVEQKPEEGEENQAGIANSAAELAEVKDRLLRIHADFDNYRKRIHKEKEEWLQYACLGFAEKLLPVLDNLDLAMLSLDQQNEEIKKIFSGLQMIAKQFQEILENEGLTPIEAVGTEFDPFLHEAVLQVPAAEGVADNQVVEEVRKGYLFKDKVLRVSMVKVAKCE